MTHDGDHFRILLATADITGATQCQGEQGGAECHANLVAQGDEGILEPVVAEARFPLSILHAIGDDGVDGRVESREEELREGSEQIEPKRLLLRAKKVDSHHGNTREEREERGCPPLIPCPSEYLREAGGTDDGGHDDRHRIDGEEVGRSLHISEVVEHIGISPVVDEAEKQLPQERQQVGAVAQGRFQLYAQIEFLLWWKGHGLPRLAETEEVASGKNQPIEHGYGEIPLFRIVIAQPADQRDRDNVDHTDGDHGTDRAAGVQLRPFVHVLRHGSAEGAVRQVHAGISQHQQAVGDGHIDDLRRLAPIGVCPKGEYKQ